MLGPLRGSFGTLRVSANGFHLDSMPVAEEPTSARALLASRLLLDLRSFRLGALDIQGLQAEVPNVRFEARLRPRPSVRFLGSGEGHGAVWTDADSVARYAERRFGSLREVQVSFKGGYIVLEAESTLLWKRASLWVAGRPVLTNPRQIGVEPVRVLLDGSRVEGASLQAWRNLLANLIDLDRDLGLRGSMDAHEVVLAKDRIEVRGAVRIPKPSPARNGEGVSSGNAG
ncbi:MAG: hypothetical protein N2109_00640 [Fimbriimonadales bacterium]|nr:hypothetical protein [Fimbriimonadales bacterium]